jgi:competence protein ComEA
MLLGLGLQQWRNGRAAAGDPVGLTGEGRWQKLTAITATGPAAPPQLPAPPVAPAEAGTTTHTTPAPNMLGEPLELNSADAAALERLPDIGATKAAAILATRARLGGFQSIDQLAEVPGIGPKTLVRLRPLLSLRPAPAAAENTPTSPSHQAVPPPVAEVIPPTAPVAQPLAAAGTPAAGTVVNLNRATAAELESLPGIGPALAQRILRDRAARGNFRSVQELDRVSGIGPAKLAHLRGLIAVE